MYHKDYSEYQNIKRSVIVLSLSLVLVYIVLYYAKWDIWKESIETQNIVSTWDVMISEVENQDWNNSGDLLVEYENLDEVNEVEVDPIEPDELTWDLEFSSDDIVWEEIEYEEEYNDEDISLLLSGTKTYYWELDFVEKLWISYDYALKDDKNIYYLNMWDYDYDFSDIVRKLWWSLYVMNTEQEIIANSMFGEKVTYINIPEYKNNKVLLLLEVDSQSWLLAIDYSIYHQVKPYLKNLFID